MQLKRLEIHGFKSFADKCVIDFPPGISVIVGPNGCGKSNIIDAIKWVMGEQSVKQLRGKSMGDVIFAGTDKRAPLNMAEVSLVFAADNGAPLPEPVESYTEIMITRRIYRSGETAYLLNKQPCRLKDIHDIFLRYGMGSRSCAIIQQGNIGAITDATPEERRSFIEEAAGVVRYKNRKQEALAKVSATRVNLERLHDILGEIEKQLNSLSRQAKKAERFREYRRLLKEAEIQVAIYYHEDYTRRIDGAEQLLAGLREKDTFHAGEIETLNAALGEMESRRRLKDKEIADKRAARSETQRNIDKLEFDLKHLSNEGAHLGEEIARLEQSLADLHEKNRKLESEIAEGTKKTASLKTRFDEVRIELDAENEAVADHRTELAQVNHRLEERKKRLIELSTQRARYENIHQNAAANKENLKRRIRQIEDDQEETGQAVAELTEQESKITQQQTDIKERLESVLRRKAECETSLKAKGAELGARIKSVNALGNDRNKVKSKLGVLKKMEANFEWYRDGVKAVMKRQILPDGSSDLRIVGVMADFIEPASGYEYAVEAMLGEALQYILVRDSSTGAEFIDYLRGENAGRSGFIPVDGENGSAGVTVIGADDAILLRHHVVIRPGYEQMLGGMFAGVAVVDDFESALSLWNAGSGFNTIVSREGDMVSGQGIMIGGSRDKLSGILEKKQEIRHLEAELALLDETIAVEKAEQEAAEAEVRNLENTLTELTQKKYRCESEQVEAEKSLYRTSEQLKHARRQLEIATLEHRRLLGEKEDITNEIARHDTALGEITKDIAAVESEIETMAGQVRFLSETIKTVENRQLDRKLDLTRLTAELENTRRTVSRLSEYYKEGIGQVEKTGQDIVIKQKRAENAREQMIAYEYRLAEASESLKLIKSHLRTEETEYQSMVERLEQTDTRISEAKTGLTQIREKIHKMELELSGLQINRENIVNRYLERYTDSFASIRTVWREVVTAPDFSIEKTENERVELRRKLDQIGDVNIGAIDAYEEQKNRHDFLGRQCQDLEAALADLENVIRKINRITQKLFIETFEAINEKFSELFPRLFNGGAAWLELTSPDSPLETGVELMIQPPGKKLSRLTLLSGGEKALSAIAFIFSIFLLNPASFCLLDEIDAPLDEVNVYRFNDLLRIIGARTQIIVISHNKKTMEFSDTLFGVTVTQGGGSRMISVNMEQAVEMQEKNQKPIEGIDYARLPQ